MMHPGVYYYILYNIYDVKFCTCVRKTQYNNKNNYQYTSTILLYMMTCNVICTCTMYVCIYLFMHMILPDGLVYITNVVHL
jgi:hypothetical protein